MANEKTCFSGRLLQSAWLTNGLDCGSLNPSLYLRQGDTLLGCFQPVMECGKDTAAGSFLRGSSAGRLWLEDPHSVPSNCTQTPLQSKTFFSFPLYHRVSSLLEADVVPCPLAPSSFSLTDMSPSDLLHIYSSWRLLLGEPGWVTSTHMNHRGILFLWEHDLNWKNKFRVEILVVNGEHIF